MNVAALIRLCNEADAPLPPLTDAYTDAEYNPVKKANVQTEFPIPRMDGVPNLDPSIFPFPTASRLLTSNSGTVQQSNGANRTVTISANKTLAEPAWKLLDNDSATTMVHNNSLAVPLILTVDFGANELVSAIAMSADNSANVLMPRNFTLDGSTDNSTFTTLVSRTGETWSDLERKVYSGFSPIVCRYIRLTVTSTGSGGTLIQRGMDFA